MTELKMELIAIVRNIAKLNTNAEINTQATLRSLGVDSLEVVNIFLNICEKYGVEIPDEEIDRLVTIDQIADYLNQQLGRA